MSTVRGSVPLVVMGLAHHVMLPFVGLPEALALDDEPPELHALSATAEVTAAMIATIRTARLVLWPDLEWIFI
jgi:hypothetical protein